MPGTAQLALSIAPAAQKQPAAGSATVCREEALQQWPQLCAAKPQHFLTGFGNVFCPGDVATLPAYSGSLGRHRSGSSSYAPIGQYLQV